LQFFTEKIVVEKNTINKVTSIHVSYQYGSWHTPHKNEVPKKIVLLVNLECKIIEIVSFKIRNCRKYLSFLYSKIKNLLVTKSLKIDCYIVKGLKDTKFRRFIASCYTIILSNGEMCNSD
jgi:hypothetical protein